MVLDLFMNSLYMLTQSMRQGNVKKLRPKKTPFFSKEKEDLPQVRFHVHVHMYMNNQVYRALLRKNEKGKKEKERKLRQPQWLRKI